MLSYNIHQHLYEIIREHFHVHQSLPYRIARSILHDQLWCILSLHPSLPIHLPCRLSRGAVPWWRKAFLLFPSPHPPSSLCFYGECFSWAAGETSRKQLNTEITQKGLTCNHFGVVKDTCNFWFYFNHQILLFQHLVLSLLSSTSLISWLNLSCCKLLPRLSWHCNYLHKFTIQFL